MTKGNIQCKNINPEGLLNPEKKKHKEPWKQPKPSSQSLNMLNTTCSN
jgi:hypothetical protein